ncbi:MAG: hypothetical protein GY827_07330 [Cytophagales bacterium]|nr:hypothetical protein [Cytophagales bacterium]
MKISEKKIGLFLVILLTSTVFSFAKSAKKIEKLISKKWKMVLTEQNDKQITPKHENLIITIKKDKTFKIEASKETTHTGTWKLSDDNNSIVLNDQTSNTELTYTIVTLDKKHLSLGGYDGNTTISLIPYKKGHRHLSHTEALIAKEWHVYKSDNELNMDMLIEFKKNKTFIFVPHGSKVPVASGRWRLSDDKKVVILEMLAQNQELKLDIISIDRHEFVLKNESNDVTNYLHDRKLYRKDLKARKKKEKEAAPAEATEGEAQ